MEKPQGPGPGVSAPALQTDAIRCRACRNTGALVWQETAQGRQLVRIEGDFYERLVKKAPFPIEIVCNRCGKAKISPLQIEDGPA